MTPLLDPRVVDVVPTRRTRLLAATLIDQTTHTSGPDAILRHLHDVPPGQVAALIGILLTQATTEQPRRRGTILIPERFTREERLRGYSQYRQGVRTPFAIACHREYQRINRRQLRARARQRQDAA